MIQGTHRFIASCAIALAVAYPLNASADASDEDRATARALAAEGHRALQRKDYQTAEDRFRRADLLVHAPTLVLDHARALIGLGRLADAYERYDLVLREGVTANAPWAWKRALKDAEREITALKPQVGWLTIRVRGPSEPTVTIDGKPVPGAGIGTRRPVDPGEHTIIASGSGYQERQSQVLVEAGKEATVELELAAEEAVSLAEEAPPPPPPAAPPVTRESEPDRTLAYVAFGAGGVGLATGIVTGILALSTRSDILAGCPDLKCSPTNDAEYARYEDDRSRYRLLGTVSGVGFGVAIAGAATGIALLLTEGDGASSTEQARITPIIGPRGLGLQGSF